MLNGLFDLDFRMNEIATGGDPLIKLNEAIDWERFRPYAESIRDKDRKSNAGRRPFDAVMMFKILILQSLYNLSDDATEYQIRDRDNNSCRELWADSAYRSEKIMTTLEAWGLREHIQRKGDRGRTLTGWEKRGNRTRARIRARVEHVFGVQAMRAGRLIVRTIGIIRARSKIGLRNLAYNLDRYAMLATANG